MKKIISGVLSAVMLTSVLCACNNSENQSDTSQSENSANSSQQTVTTEAMAAQITTQPATEPNYENTNYVAPILQKNQKYKFEEISLDEAATSSGYSMSDSNFRISEIYENGEYLVVNVMYSNYNSTSNFCAYNVIFFVYVHFHVFPLSYTPEVVNPQTVPFPSAFSFHPLNV